MSRLIAMPEIARLHKGLGIVICVPGGWHAKVATVQAEGWLVGAYARYYGTMGKGADKALQLAEEVVNKTYIHGYIDGLRECIVRRSAEYAEIWPALIAPTGKLHGRKKVPIVTLRGFDPAVIQTVYIPFQNFGRAGTAHARQVLVDMGRAVQ